MKNIGEEYFDILLENSYDMLEEFLLLNGKEKPECPIIFINNDDEN